MQRLSAEDEMKVVLLNVMAGAAPAELLASLPIEKRLAGLSEKEILERIPIDKRLAGLSPKERLQGLTPEELKLLRQWLLPTEESSETVLLIWQRTWPI